MIELKEDGTVVQGSETLGVIDGFIFKPFATTETLTEAGIFDFLANEFEKRIDALLNLGDTAIRFGQDLSIQANGHVIAQMKKSDHILTPAIELMIDDTIQGLSLARLGLHIESWIKRHINIPLDTLFKLKDATDLSEAANTFKTALVNHLGCCERRKLENEIKALTPEDRVALRKYGVRFAQYTVFVRDILKPAAMNIKLVLDAVFHGKTELPPYPTAGMVAIAHNPELDRYYYNLCGFRVCDKIAVRIDMIEKLIDTLRPLSTKTETNPNGEFSVDAQMMSLIGRSGEEFETVLKSLGYRFRTEKQAKPAPVIPTGENTSEIVPESENTVILAPAGETVTPAPHEDTIEVKIWFKAPPPVKKEFGTTAPRSHSTDNPGEKPHHKGHFLRTKKPHQKTPESSDKPIGDDPKNAKDNFRKKPFEKKVFDKKKPVQADEKKPKMSKVSFKGDPESPFAALTRIKNKIA